MDKMSLGVNYSTEYFEDFKDGFGAINLFSSILGEEKKLIARITFWDAMGDVTIEVFSDNIPGAILEEAITECKERNTGK